MKSALQYAIQLQESLNKMYIRDDPDLNKDKYEDFGIGPLKPIGKINLSIINNACKKFGVKIPVSLASAITELPNRYQQDYEFDCNEDLRTFVEKNRFMGGFSWFNFDDDADFKNTITLVSRYNGDNGAPIIPVIKIGNGDSICVSTESENVLYCYCGDGSSVIGHSVNDFYSKWSSVNFIGPEHWWLFPFLRDEDGKINLSGINPIGLRVIRDFFSSAA